MLRVGVVSDTHAPRFWKALPPNVAGQLEAVDIILHAGDVCVPSVLDELAAFAPVYVVQGNNDGDDVAAWGAPETVELELDGLRIAMIHDSGPKQGRARRMRARFPHADLVVFGHSHIPWDTEEDGQRLFNPGSPTDKRRQPHGTMGHLVIDDGRLVSATIVPVS
jgi:putative phosphoesterase